MKAEIWGDIAELRTLKKLVNPINVCEKGSQNTERMKQSQISVNSRLTHRDALSPLLFNIVQEGILRKIAHKQYWLEKGTSYHTVVLRQHRYSSSNFNEDKTYGNKKRRGRERLGHSVTMDQHNFERVFK